MQSGFIAPASSLASAYALSGPMVGEAGRSDSLTLTPPLLLPLLFRLRRDGGRRGPPRVPCQQLLTSSLASASGGLTEAGGSPVGVPGAA